MNRFFSAFLILGLLFSSLSNIAMAHSPKIYESYFIHDLKMLTLFRARPEFIIDHVSPAGFELYGPKGTGTFLNRTRVISEMLLPVAEPIRAQYPTPEQSAQQLKDLALAHPEIAQVFSIGKSAKGRDLWVIKITKNIAQPSNLPEFKYIANMHGDEIVGRELMLLLAQELLTGYGKEPRVTNLIDQLQIYILPSMNPDGAAAGTRYNAKNVDLNRDFPEWSNNDANTSTGRGIETQLVMNWQKQHQFILSANFHGGAEVVNYPWDGVQQVHPLNDLVKSLSLNYAKQAPYIYNSTQFENGITNGWAWYEVKGGMQDWSWYFYKDLQLTIELSNSKWPSASTIPNYWNSNKIALIDYIDQALKLHQTQ
jgi:hypothetical protein